MSAFEHRFQNADKAQGALALDFLPGAFGLQPQFLICHF
jgi:hypothetical protein